MYTLRVSRARRTRRGAYSTLNMLMNPIHFDPLSAQTICDYPESPWESCVLGIADGQVGSSHSEGRAPKGVGVVTQSFASGYSFDPMTDESVEIEVNDVVKYCWVQARMMRQEKSKKGGALRQSNFVHAATVVTAPQSLQMRVVIVKKYCLKVSG